MLLRKTVIFVPEFAYFLMSVLNETSKRYILW